MPAARSALAAESEYTDARQSVSNTRLGDAKASSCASPANRVAVCQASCCHSTCGRRGRTADDRDIRQDDSSYVDARTLTAGVLDGAAKRRDAWPPNPQLQPIQRPRQIPTIEGRQARNYRECVRRSPGRSLSP